MLLPLSNEVIVTYIDLITSMNVIRSAITVTK